MITSVIPGNMQLADVQPPTDATLALADSIRRRHKESNEIRASLLAEIAEFDEGGHFYSLGAASTGSWLERELKYPRTTAYEYVRVGRKLRDFPLLQSFFADGSLDYTTVRLLVRHVTPENESELVGLALRLCYAELEKALAGNPPDGGGTPDAPFLRTHTREDGMLSVSALLPPVEGQAFLAALKIAQLIGEGADPAELDAAIAQLIAEEEPAVEEPAEEEPAVEAVEEACPGEQVRGPKGITTETILGVPSLYGPPMKGDMYAAFLTMINMVRSSPHPATRAPGAQVTIMLTEDGKAWMPGNPQAPSTSLQHYVANATVRCHLLDSQGLTMHFGRRRRFASQSQIQALLDVWGHQCAMPGCTHSRYLEIHHIREWAAGGGTDIGNLIPLCSSCHSKVSHGIALITQRGAELKFSFLDGSVFVSRNRGLPEDAGNVSTRRAQPSSAG